MNTRFPTEAERKKRTALIELLEGGIVMVHLDARYEGVDVPEHLKESPALALNLSHAFRLDVFELGPYAVTASLSFGDSRYACVLPWGSIFAMTRHSDDERRVLVESMPPELIKQLVAHVDADKGETDGEPTHPDPDKNEVESASPKQASRPVLRLLDSP